MRANYCVYTHLRPNDSIFYVGKGLPSRPYRDKNRNSLWQAEVEKNNGFTVNIVKSNLTEKEAFDVEVRLIKKLRNAGIQLTNLTRGGDGCKELVFTEEIKQKLKIARINQIPPTTGKKWSNDLKQFWSSLKRGENNPMYGKKHTDETKEKFKNRQTVKYWTNKIMPLEIKQKMSSTHKNKPKLKCPHCDKIGGFHGMNRWHMDNCKTKVI